MKGTEVTKRSRPGIHERPASPEFEAQTIERLVRESIAEDLGTGDATTESIFDATTESIDAAVVAREPGVLSGVEVARAVAKVIDPAVTLSGLSDGEPFEAGQTVLELSGSPRSLLSMERLVLNFLQRLSGVATLTRRYVDAVTGTGVTIVDTRKTTPGLRALEKAAVRDGGGANHRMGLFDAMMIKDNHIAAAGGIESAIAKARETQPDLFLVVEADTPEQAAAAAALGVDQILLDNMSPITIELAIKGIRAAEATYSRPQTWIEVSGGVTLETVRSKAIEGVDLISVGALTHSAIALDLSLEFDSP